MRLAMLLWGDSGSGKTTLAATAPGTKLFLMFDPDGGMSLTGRSDILVLDLSAETPLRVLSQFRNADPFGLRAYLTVNPQVETVVVDSMTTFAYIALQEAVSKNPRSSLETPGMHGYQWRNASVLRATMAMMQITKALGRNLILTTHEGTADRNDDGVVVSVTMALSEGTANQVGLRFNEVLHLTDNGKDRVIAVRPCRLRKPMKSRIFDSKQAEFVWSYDPSTGEGEGIATWFDAWKKNGGKKIPMPRSKR
jgi:hypothetical protein